MVTPHIREIFNSSQDFETKIDRLQPQVSWEGRKFSERGYRGTLDFKTIVRGTIELFQKPGNNLNQATKQKIVDSILRKNDEANRQLENAPLHVRVITFFRRIIGNIGFNKEAEINKLISLANRPVYGPQPQPEQHKASSLDEQLVILDSLYTANETQDRQQKADDYFKTLFKQVLKDPKIAPDHLNHIRAIIYAQGNKARPELLRAAVSAFQSLKDTVRNEPALLGVNINNQVMLERMEELEHRLTIDPNYTENYISEVLTFLQNPAVSQ